uniref:Uncharacterized protein n=1 Tax=Leersia perrieri TaxID=77586 RepID=A0A0D9Y0H0_9ORYZ
MVHIPAKNLISEKTTTTPEAETHIDVIIETRNAARIGLGARKVIIIPKYVMQRVKNLQDIFKEGILTFHKSIGKEFSHLRKK